MFSEGLHFRLPWLQYPIIYDIRSKPRKISSPTGSKDLQMVNISLRVLARPDARHLPQIYRTLGQDFDERVLPSICNEVFTQTKTIQIHFFLNLIDTNFFSSSLKRY